MNYKIPAPSNLIAANRPVDESKSSTLLSEGSATIKAYRVEFPGAFYRAINRDDAGDHIIKGLGDRDLSP